MIELSKSQIFVIYLIPINLYIIILFISVTIPTKKNKYTIEITLAADGDLL